MPPASDFVCEHTTGCALGYNVGIMLIGLISDLHGSLPDAAVQALKDCDAIICAGDTESRTVMMQLECIAPTVAILGNCDRFTDYGPTVHDVARPSFEGVRFYVVHRPQDIPAELPRGTQVVVHGHTHQPRFEEIKGVLYLNPGSPTYPRGGSEPSVMTLEVEECEAYDVQHIILTPYGPRREGDTSRSANHWEDLDDFDDLGDHTHIDFSEIGF